jgi:hypothetical protein
VDGVQARARFSGLAICRHGVRRDREGAYNARMKGGKRGWVEDKVRLLAIGTFVGLVLALLVRSYTN